MRERDISEESTVRLGDALPPPPERTFGEGASFGPWRVTAFLGKGGGGEVYRVVRADDPSVDAALKVHVPRPDADEAHRRDALARFEREIRFLAEHDQPCFPRYVEDGIEKERRYLVMELLLPIDDPPTDDRHVAAFLLAVCDAVRTLHRAGFVHRDIKPRNLMLRRDGRIVLIDLGLVKRAPSPESPADGRTLVNGKPVAAGTYRYSAPEQFEDGAVTTTADIHAIGVIADECFGGKPPHSWNRIIRRAASSIPGQRYPTVEALARDIRRRHAGAWVRASVAFALLLGLLGGARFLHTDVRVSEWRAWKTLQASAIRHEDSHKVLVRLNGARHAFSLPVPLRPHTEYHIEGPGSLDADLRGGEGTVLHLTRCEVIARTRTPPSPDSLRFVLHGDVRLDFIALPDVPLHTGTVTLAEGERNSIEFATPASLEPWNPFLSGLSTSPP